MALCPFARQRLLPESETQPRRSGPAVIIDHSIVGSAEGAYGYFLRSSSLESHFIVGKDGGIWQLIDTSRTADANYRANPFAISIETEDNGDPNRDPWTEAQLDALVRLHNWIADTHGVRRRKCPSWDESGLGYHTLFGAPSQWTPVAKSCPGTVRIKQWNDILLPAFVSGETPSLGGRVMYVCKKGDKGPAVTLLQETLNDLGAKLTVDGDYGDATAAAVTKVMGWKDGDGVSPQRCRRIENKLIDSRIDKRVDRHVANKPHGGDVGAHTHTATVELT